MIKILVMNDGRQVITDRTANGYGFPMYIHIKQTEQGIQVGFQPLIAFGSVEEVDHINEDHITTQYEPEEQIAKMYKDQVEGIREEKRRLDSGIETATKADLRRIQKNGNIINIGGK